MVFIHQMLSVEDEWAFIYIFFSAIIVVNIFENPAFFVNFLIFFFLLTDIMTYNQHKRN